MTLQPLRAFQKWVRTKTHRSIQDGSCRAADTIKRLAACNPLIGAPN